MVTYEFTHYLVAPGETIDIPDGAWIISAEVEEGGKIRVIVGAYIPDKREVF